MRRQLEPLLVDRRITDAGSHPSAKFNTAPEAVGPAIEEVRRRGKYLLTGLDDGRELIIHLGMTGHLHPREPGTGPGAYNRAWWALDDGNVLDFDDTRRFGRIAVLPAGDYRSLPTLHHLGPEPFDDAFTEGGLWRALRASSTRVKTQLLHQRVVAGVGNIYADEALWDACVHPASRRVTRAAGGASARRPAEGPPARDRPRRHDPARLPHRRRRGGPQPGAPRLLRPVRPPLPAVRHPAAPPGVRRALRHLVPGVPAALAPGRREHAG